MPRSLGSRPRTREARRDRGSGSGAGGRMLPEDAPSCSSAPQGTPLASSELGLARGSQGGDTPREVVLLGDAWSCRTRHTQLGPHSSHTESYQHSDSAAGTRHKTASQERLPGAAGHAGSRIV
jgi:hypothetical protein